MPSTLGSPLKQQRMGFRDGGRCSEAALSQNIRFASFAVDDGGVERQQFRARRFYDGRVLYICVCVHLRARRASPTAGGWMQRTQLQCTRRACTCETLEGVEERIPGRGCRRFEVALILSRQGGDYSRGIVLRVHRFRVPACRSPVKMFYRLAPRCIATRRGTSGSPFL